MKIKSKIAKSIIALTFGIYATAGVQIASADESDSYSNSYGTGVYAYVTGGSWEDYGYEAASIDVSIPSGASVEGFTDCYAQNGSLAQAILSRLSTVISSCFAHTQTWEAHDDDGGNLNFSGTGQTYNLDAYAESWDYSGDSFASIDIWW